MAALSVITAPVEYPVSLEEAKGQCRITSTAHDILIDRLVAAATSLVQTMTGTLLCQQTVRLDLDGFPCGDIDLSLYPVQSITSIKYDDTSDDEQTLVANTDYWVSLAGMYPKVTPVTVWPYAMLGKPASVRITMVVGYSDVNNIPEDLRHAILVKVKELYDHSGETILGINTNPSANTVPALVALHRRLSI